MTTIDLSLLARTIQDLLLDRGECPAAIFDESECGTVRAAYDLSPSATVMFVRRRLARVIERLRDETTTGDVVLDARIALGAAEELRRLRNRVAA